MAKLYITEYETPFPREDAGIPMPRQPRIAAQVLTFTGAAQVSASFNERTKMVRLHTDAICSVKFGGSSLAADGVATTDERMAANQTEYHYVSGGMKVAVVTNT